MKKESVLIFLGILVALIPFSGLPADWKQGLTILLGIAVALNAFVVRARRRRVCDPETDAACVESTSAEKSSPDS